MILKLGNITIIMLLFLSANRVQCDLKIEVMKEGLLDLKTTILRPPNVTEFSGSAQESYIGGTSGELFPFFPIDGCSDLQESSPFTAKDEKSGKLKFSTVNEKFDGSIVLISRGGCSFNEKFRNAKKVKGVLGVLIFNGPDDVLQPTGKITLTNDNEDLPGYLVSNSLGLELYNKMIKYRSNNNTVDSLSAKSSVNNRIPFIEITMTPVSIDGNNNANAMIQMALIAIIIILALSFGASIIFHMRAPPQNSTSTNSDDGREDLAPIDVEFLQKLPLKTFKGRRNSVNGNSNTGISKSANVNTNTGNTNNAKNSNDVSVSPSYSGIKSPTVNDEKSLLSPTGNEWFEMIHHDWPMNDSCPICLDEFNQNEVLNELPCGHCYHIACIQPWLQYRSPNCPLCKLDVREEFKPSNPKTELSEDATRSKLRSVWNKLLLKSTPSDQATSNTTPPIMSTSISMTELSQLSTLRNAHEQQLLQVPQRALIHDSNDFHSVPL